MSLAIRARNYGIIMALIHPSGTRSEAAPRSTEGGTGSLRVNGAHRNSIAKRDQMSVASKIFENTFGKISSMVHWFCFHKEAKWAGDLASISLSRSSVARWLDYFSLFGYSQQINLPKIYKNDKVGLKFCQTLNKLSEVCLRFLKVCPNGEVSPNLVTLSLRKTRKKCHKSGLQLLK